MKLNQPRLKVKKKNAKKSPKKAAGKKQAKPSQQASLNTAYILDQSDAAVTLEMILGAPGQTGTTHIMLDNAHLLVDHKGSIPEFALGTNKKLNGQTLYITTVVSDTSRDTNYCESILRFRGGLRFQEYTLYKTVPEEGDDALFTSVIEFFSK